MDWTLAIEKNREALRRILAMLVAMIGETVGSEDGQSDRPQTLPRHLHRFVLRLLRPAEAAARRLIIVAARGLVVTLPRPRQRNAKPKPILNRHNGFGTGVVIRPGPLPEWAKALAPKRSSSLSLPLFDPLKRYGVRRRSVRQSAMPRISFLDSRPINPLFHPPRQPDPVRPPPSPDDPLDARRLHLRLEAIGQVLEDLPLQAKRLARWQARRDAALGRVDDVAGAPQSDARHGADVQRKCRVQRCSPVRPGRPPGWRRRPDHAVYGVLDELHGLAVWARERRDTS